MMDRALWRDHLRSFIQARRAAQPIPQKEELGRDPLRLWQYRVEGGFMQAWCQQYGPQMLRERALLLERTGRVGADPVVVIHGDMPVVVACRVLLEDGALEGEGPAVAMLDAEYEAFVKQHAEAREFDYHISSWSRFEPADPAVLEKARSLGHAISPERTYHAHITGTLFGPRCGLQAESLWSWDGQALTLVEEGIRHARF